MTFVTVWLIFVYSFQPFSLIFLAKVQRVVKCICIIFSSEILDFYRLALGKACYWQQVCAVLSESESVQTEWRGSPDLHIADTLTPDLLRWWWRKIVTLWHDVRVMFRLEAGCRDPDQERTPGKLWTRLRHQSLISPFLRHLSHGTQWEVRIVELQSISAFCDFKDKQEYH